MTETSAQDHTQYEFGKIIRVTEATIKKDLVGRILPIKSVHDDTTGGTGQWAMVRGDEGSLWTVRGEVLPIPKRPVFALEDKVKVVRVHTAHQKAYSTECAVGSTGTISREATEVNPVLNVDWDSHPEGFSSTTSRSAIDGDCLEILAPHWATPHAPYVKVGDTVVVNSALGSDGKQEHYVSPLWIGREGVVVSTPSQPNSHHPALAPTLPVVVEPLNPDPELKGVQHVGHYTKKGEEPQATELQPGQKVEVVKFLDGATQEFIDYIRSLPHVVYVRRDEVLNTHVLELPDGFSFPRRLDLTSAPQFNVKEARPLSPVEPKKDSTDWSILITSLLDSVHQEAISHGWCGEYEEVMETAFGVIPESRSKEWSVHVRLRRSIDLEDHLSADLIFGAGASGNVETRDLSDVYYEVSVDVSSDSEAPGHEQVDEALGLDDYEYDDFEIIDITEIDF